jgi:hypothetical protein
VGLGTKARQAKSYDLAVWAFTGAQARIIEAELSGSSPTRTALLDYVKRAACLTRAGARADQTYTGILKALPAETCTVAP